MFPIINQIFRPKGKLQIATLHVEETKRQLLQDTEDASKIPINSNKYIINDPHDKLNVLGKHFASIYTQNDNLGTEGLKKRCNKIYKYS